ncbi:MAG: hypothetical protein KJO50_01190 [Bacteroidia bacterium]|nr:hypothetical protein [Bacteroidia bacterium]
MKNLKLFFPFLILLMIILCQSCTVTGLLIGEAKRSKDIEASKTAILDAKGWIEPANKNYNLNLTLKNDDVIFGRYQGKDYYWDGHQTIEMIVYGDSKHQKSVAVKDIKNTKIFIRPKKSAGNGALIGAAADAVWIGFVILTASNSGGLFDFNISIMGN